MCISSIYSGNDIYHNFYSGIAIGYMGSFHRLTIELSAARSIEVFYYLSKLMLLRS